MAIDPQEESERVRKAHENVAKWKEKYIGNDGFSGGVRMTVETQDGIAGSRTEYLGDPAARRTIAAPLEKPPQPSSIMRTLPQYESLHDKLPKVIVQPKPWWHRLFNLFIVEKL